MKDLTLIKEFKCPRCGKTEATSAYRRPDGSFSHAACFNCYAGLSSEFTPSELETILCDH